MRAPSVSGIGNVGEYSSCLSLWSDTDDPVEKPDMSEAKIVVAMVRVYLVQLFSHGASADITGRTSRSGQVVPQ
jgi:hypothetical protein